MGELLCVSPLTISNVKSEHIYAHMSICWIRSSISKINTFSLRCLLFYLKMQFYFEILRQKLLLIRYYLISFFAHPPPKFTLKWENSVNLTEKYTITGFDLTSFDMWNKNSDPQRLWEMLMENYRWWINHRKTNLFPWMQYRELK